MNRLLDFIGRQLPFFGVLLLTAFLGAALGLYLDVPGRIQNAVRAKEIKASAGQYSCPMHPEVVSAQPGPCSKCGMALTLAFEAPSEHAGCVAKDQAETHGCCPKLQTTELKLPPGHPPVPGWNTHAGCEPLSGNVGQDSSVTVRGASLPRNVSGKVPAEPAAKMPVPQATVFNSAD